MVIRSVSDQRHYARTNTAIQERSLCIIIDTSSNTVNASREPRWISREYRPISRVRYMLDTLYCLTSTPERSYRPRIFEGVDCSTRKGEIVQRHPN